MPFLTPSQYLTDWIVAEFNTENDVDLSNDPMAMKRIRDAAEKATVELSSKGATEINLPFITADSSGPKHLRVELTRAKLDDLARGR
jgi:molecular chaperone DnaK